MPRHTLLVAFALVFTSAAAAQCGLLAGPGEVPDLLRRLSPREVLDIAARDGSARDVEIARGRAMLDLIQGAQSVPLRGPDVRTSPRRFSFALTGNLSDVPFRFLQVHERGETMHDESSVPSALSAGPMGIGRVSRAPYARAIPGTPQTPRIVSRRR